MNHKLTKTTKNFCFVCFVIFVAQEEYAFSSLVVA